MDEPLKGSKDYHVKNNNSENYRQLSVHGLKYLARKSKCETIFFATILLISILLSTISILILSQSEIRHSSALQPQPIHNLPFAAVTICPETKAKKSLINFTGAYAAIHTNKTESNLSHDEISMIEALSQVCDSHLFEAVKLSSNPTPGSKFSEILNNINDDSYTLFCKFRSELSSCDDFFEETMTDVGICKTFNLVKDSNSSKDLWSPENGYKSDKYDVHPHRAFSGAFIGLNVVLSQNTLDMDFMCSGPVQGWKVKIHAPNEFPTMISGFSRIPLGKETTVVVNPEVNLYSSGSCHSSTSKKLKNFNQYSQQNCMIECLSSFVLSKCGCVKLSMVYDSDDQICNQHKTKCVTDATKEFYTDERVKHAFPCDCKPSCKTVKYNSKLYEADFNFKKVFNAYKENPEDEFPSLVMSRLVVYIENDFYVPKDQSNEGLASLVTFISKLGGVLAFFLGASWISFIEVFYYFTNRRN